MKKIKRLGSICIVVAAAFILYVFFAGVKLVVENHSGQKIRNVEIKYGRGTFSADSIQDNEIRTKCLGKIGEGATFDVQWRDNSGNNQHAQFSVYFYGHSGYHTVRVEVLPRGEVVLHEGERIYKPTKTAEN